VVLDANDNKIKTLPLRIEDLKELVYIYIYIYIYIYVKTPPLRIQDLKDLVSDNIKIKAERKKEEKNKNHLNPESQVTDCDFRFGHSCGTLN
jgi:hypothetical protein